MKDKKWYSGPPPSIGWWPASCKCRSGIYRWWNGEYWSFHAMEGDTLTWVRKAAKGKAAVHQEQIKWQHRPDSWPERSKT